MIEIRAAEVSDAGAIAAVHVASWQVAYRDLLPEGVLDGLSVAGREQMWSAILGELSPRSSVYVAARRGAVLGFASIGASRDGDAGGDVGELGAFYLQPGHWRQGIGSRLHTAVVAGLWDLGFSAATLWVLEGNDRALRFYEQAGWVEDGQFKVDRGPGGVELRERRMHRALTAV
ncbi:N-acetyltransferase family protein [Pseudonocardia sp. CA-142604]|uniref:GNAT family N-acetyltransferase n=1 Tax=Pseudonocardia sp. CA-142604 TaxID=3240024 RepID=UPI003D908713